MSKHSRSDSSGKNYLRKLNKESLKVRVLSPCPHAPVSSRKWDKSGKRGESALAPLADGYPHQPKTQEQGGGGFGDCGVESLNLGGGQGAVVDVDVVK